MLLAKIKDECGSNRPLLGTDPTSATNRQVQGVRLLTAPSVAAGVIWGLPSAFCFVVIRDDTRIEVDRSVFFTSDRVAVKATMSIGFGFPHPAAVVKITIGP